jgi:hypothetical protein
VRLRKRYLPLVAVLGAAVAIVPALAAPPSEVKLEVNENCVEPAWPCWATPGSSTPASKITIAPGGEVKFADKATTAAAVVWTGSAPTCSGVPAGAMTNWEGTCRFGQEGTYDFESSTLFIGLGENYTKYEVVVQSASTSTTSTTTTTTTPTITTTTTDTTTTQTTTPPASTTATATTSTQPSGGGASTGAVASTATTPVSMDAPLPPVGSVPLATLALASAQQGDAVHGTVQIPAADSGARLEIELLAQSASLAKVKRPGSSRVGRLVRSSAPAGKMSFTVSLDARAKRALRRHHKLALTVKIVLTPAHGAAATITRSVVVR